ncbi:MAG TPA: acyl-CoA dehydrogenase family protein [Kofleriaceae bacterium]|jgi:alkylation response protein AidB-like acyl-CoA dehydrogenase
MDFKLDDEQDLIVQTVRRFAERELRGWAAEADREAKPPDRLRVAGAELGFFDAPDETFSHQTRALRGFELGRGCAALAAILEAGVEAQLAAKLDGATIAYGATFDGDRVSGTITAPALAVAKHVLVVGERVGVVELGERTPIAPSGWRAAQWATAKLDGTRAQLLDIDPAEVRAWANVSLAARATGVAAAAMEYAKQYATERIQFGQPIGAFESIIRLRDDAETLTAAARLASIHAAWALDVKAPDAFDLASRARVLAGDAVTRATIDAVQIFGGYGFVNDYPVEKLMRDARAFEALGGDQRAARIAAQKGR